MHKKALATLLAVLILAAAGVIGWPHFKAWQLKRVLDTVVIPQMQDSLRQMGWGPAKTTYRGVAAEGPDFAITGLALAVEGWPKIELKVDKVLLRQMGLDFGGNLTGLDCLFSGIAWSGPFGLLAAEEIVLEGITPENDWQDVTVRRYAFHGLSHQGPGEAASVPVGSLEGRDYMLDQERGGKGFAATLGPAEFKAGYFTLRVARTAFRAGGGSGEAWAKSSARVEMTDVAISAGGKTIPVQRGEISAMVGETAMRTRLAFSGLALEAQALPHPQARAELKKLGYDTLKVDAALAYRFERDQGLLAIDELMLNLDRAGKVTASLELGGVKRDLVNDPGQDLQWLENAYLKGLRLAYQDRSLVERVMANLAKERGIPLALFKEAAILGLEAKGLWHGVYLGALPGFIRRPQSLCAEARPSGQLTLGRAWRLPPEQVAKAWNVRLSPCR